MEHLIFEEELFRALRVLMKRHGLKDEWRHVFMILWIYISMRRSNKKIEKACRYRATVERRLKLYHTEAVVDEFMQDLDALEQ